MNAEGDVAPQGGQGYLFVMGTFQCVRCGQPGARISAPPLPNELGNRLYDQVCQTCWQDWLREQTAIINHYGLNLMDPKARAFLMEQTEGFFFASRSE